MAKLDNLLARCLGELEANGGDVEACLRLHPEQADELRPYLMLWAGLRSVAAPAPQPAALSAGREKLVKAAIDVKNTRKEGGLMWKNPVYRLATAIGGSLLLGVAALGIAGAAGGGGSAGDVLQTLHLTSVSGGSAVASTTATPALTPTVAPTPAPTPTVAPKIAATNPDGHCVMLPATSDIVEQPEKHPDWHLLGGDCATPSPGGSSASPTPTAQADENSDSNGPKESPGASPGPRTAATNPDGQCVMLPDTSDVIRHPDKHSGWQVMGGGCPSTSATSSATSTPSPTPTPTPSATVASGSQSNPGTEHQNGRPAGSAHGHGNVD
jgi:hypothetical protein